MLITRALWDEDVVKVEDRESKEAPHCEVAQLRIILIANKAEHGYIGPYLNDCYELGVGDPVRSLAWKGCSLTPCIHQILGLRSSCQPS